MVALIADLIETSLLPADPCDRPKARAVTVHQLTDIQHAEKLLAMPPMGQQKLSEERRSYGSAQGKRRTLSTSTVYL